MAELNLKQIIDRLNMEFTGDTRKLVFWYDDNGEFAEDMKDIELENARVYYLEQDNRFYTKYFLERVDTTTNYLIYAPFPKPDVRENHLENRMCERTIWRIHCCIPGVSLQIVPRCCHWI